MSNVQYRCVTCGGRMFAKPGGTKMRCHRDDGAYKQTEVSHAPDFGYYNPEAGVNQSVTGHSAGGMKNAKPVPPNEKKLAAATTLDLADYDQLVALYMEKFRERPDGRWGLERLKAEVEKAEEDPDPELPSPVSSESEAKEDPDGVESREVDSSATG